MYLFTFFKKKGHIVRIDAHVIDLKHVKLDCLSYVKREGWQVLNIYDCIISYFLEMLANSWFLEEEKIAF